MTNEFEVGSVLPDSVCGQLVRAAYDLNEQVSKPQTVVGYRETRRLAARLQACLDIAQIEARE
ncbi:hypothetical protein FHS85_001868 [Rhodoligotrophos appendicifer]